MTATAMLMPGARVRVSYTNWRGETAVRNIEIVGAPHWGKSPWHSEPQWFVAGADLDRNQHRLWAVKDMVPVQ